MVYQMIHFILQWGNNNVKCISCETLCYSLSVSKYTIKLELCVPGVRVISRGVFLSKFIWIKYETFEELLLYLVHTSAYFMYRNKRQRFLVEFAYNKHSVWNLRIQRVLNLQIHEPCGEVHNLWGKWTKKILYLPQI
jgi:hypothetical protein